MTNKKLYEVLCDIDEKYIQEANEYHKAKKPVWFKWGAVAALLCIAVFGYIVLQQRSVPSETTIGHPPETTIGHQEDPALVINPVDRVTQVDLDVKISPYDELSADEWQAAADVFEQAIGMRYEDFTNKLPESYRQTAFYSIDAPAVPKDGSYVPHDYVFEFLTEAGGEVEITICGKEEPLTDHFFLCEHPKESSINGTSVVIYDVQDSFVVRFLYQNVNYAIETRSISLEEVQELLRCIIR